MKRAKWKGLNVCVKFQKKTTDNKKPFKTTRNSVITPCYIGQKLKIHTGKTFSVIEITKDMLGHKFGEFSPTRETFVFKKKKKK